MTRDRYTFSVPTLAGLLYLLPAYHAVQVNRMSGVVTLTNEQEQHDVACVRFDGTELPLIRALFEKWPSYVEYHLLQTLTESGLLLEVQELLHQSQDRLHDLGLHVDWIQESGFRLARWEDGNDKHL